MGFYEYTAMSFRYDLILFDKYGPENFKMFFDAKIRMILRNVSINMRNEWKHALAAKRKEPIIRLQMDGIIANSVARRILHFVQRLSLGGLLCLHSV